MMKVRNKYANDYQQMARGDILLYFLDDFTSVSRCYYNEAHQAGKVKR